jgi:hypothetical protein
MFVPGCMRFLFSNVIQKMAVCRILIFMSRDISRTQNNSLRYWKFFRPVQCLVDNIQHSQNKVKFIAYPL